MAACSPLRAVPLPLIDTIRCDRNPLIRPQLSATIGTNINGPSVIRAPDWLPNRLGRYYLYFADHRGAFIRLAHADELCGEWTIHEPGTLHIEQAEGFKGHIASPDVHVDEADRQIRMYFHAPTAGGGGQATGVAVSSDGIHFTVLGGALGEPYFRVVPWRDAWLAIAKRGRTGGGVLYRGSDPTQPFLAGDEVIPRMRHAAVLPWQDDLLVFFSRIGDAPERILVTRLTFGGSGERPQMGEVRDVLTPLTAAEGADLPVSRSRPGATGRARQLRDPAIFIDEGTVYLFYALAGESGIGLAELRLRPQPLDPGTLRNSAEERPPP